MASSWAAKGVTSLGLWCVGVAAGQECNTGTTWRQNTQSLACADAMFTVLFDGWEISMGCKMGTVSARVYYCCALSGAASLQFVEVALPP